MPHYNYIWLVFDMSLVMCNSPQYGVFELAIIQCLRHVLQLDRTIESLIALIDMIYKQPCCFRNYI